MVAQSTTVHEHFGTFPSYVPFIEIVRRMVWSGSEALRSQPLATGSLKEKSSFSDRASCPLSRSMILVGGHYFEPDQKILVGSFVQDSNNICPL